MKKSLKIIILIICIYLFICIAEVSAIHSIDISDKNGVVSLVNEVITSPIEMTVINENQIVNNSINNNIVGNNIAENITNDEENSNGFPTMYIVGIVSVVTILLGIIIFFVIKKR